MCRTQMCLHTITQKYFHLSFILYLFSQFLFIRFQFFLFFFSFLFSPITSIFHFLIHSFLIILFDFPPSFVLATLCRKEENYCDIAEYCDGISYDCPEDIKKPGWYSFASPFSQIVQIVSYQFTTSLKLIDCLLMKLILL